MQKTGIFKKIKKFYLKLTLFDQLLAGLAIAGVVTFAYIFLRGSAHLTVTLKVGPEDVYYSVYGAGVPTWFENFFHIGMVEKNGLGTTQAEVLQISSYYKRPQTLNLYIKTRLRVTYNRASNQYTYKGTPVVIGTKLKLFLDGVQVDGLVTNIEGQKDTRETKKLTIETKIIDENPTYLESSGTKAYLADVLNIGDEIKDLQDNVVIKIINKRTEPAKKVTTAANGTLTVQPDPLRKDVYLTLEVVATKIQNRYFIFDDIPILIDQAIPINTSTVSLWTTITKVVDIK